MDFLEFSDVSAEIKGSMVKLTIYNWQLLFVTMYDWV